MYIPWYVRMVLSMYENVSSYSLAYTCILQGDRNVAGTKGRVGIFLVITDNILKVSPHPLLNLICAFLLVQPKKNIYCRHDWYLVSNNYPIHY